MSVERIAVVGAGVMGRGIAHAGALGGFEVRGCTTRTPGRWRARCAASRGR